MHHRPLLRYRASIGHGAVEHFVFLSQVLVELELVGDGISNLNAKHEIDERSQACANRAAGKVGTQCPVGLQRRGGSGCIWVWVPEKQNPNNEGLTTDAVLPHR